MNEEISQNRSDLFTAIEKITVRGLPFARENTAISMAKLAEQAYRFERSDDTNELLGSGYWDASNAGLIAGERLLIDLQNLEQQFIESNYRNLEINQSFSLAQFAPAALVQLKENAECEFEVPELFFDLFYPGHYRRRIKSARLTIPCVAGPFTNVSATLNLLDSWIRTNPSLNEPIQVVPRSRSVSIATSNAQNDAGVFELNFHDERYMPFEGAGAISRWKLSLPKNFRQFNYDTMTDVILHVSYTAEQDGVLRQAVEEIKKGIEGTTLKTLMDTQGGLSRLFSLRHDFYGAFQSLMTNPPGTEAIVELTEKHFPFFVHGSKIPKRTWKIQKATLLLVGPKEAELGTFSVSIDGQPVTDFDCDSGLGELCSANLTGLLGTNEIHRNYSFLINDPGGLAQGSSIDTEKLRDILLYLTYCLLN